MNDDGPHRQRSGTHSEAYFFQASSQSGLTQEHLSAPAVRRDIARGFREGLRQALSAYGEDEGKADALDALQHALGCCGVESYRDWLASPWALQQNASVPLSCCRARRGCPLSSTGAHGLHPEGCFGKVSAFVSSNMFCVATAALGLAVLQVVGIVLACLMAARVPARVTAPH
ncbi:CD63 antigen-like [Meleagris gallopavo]|uniref:CD63 antigen-like n=1 Tax=Meleagris gallopavo TaxID=9103 RepID=UPI000549A003|nr:CD63 antigen-like [Meleagris gallopavo]